LPLRQAQGKRETLVHPEFVEGAKGENNKFSITKNYLIDLNKNINTG
jgi:hypothetical protein